jgi:transcriptional regulator with XRE-family HTH domain
MDTSELHTFFFASGRDVLGLTQKQLAEQLGVTANTVARWERGELPVSMLAILAMNYLVGKSEDEKKAPPPTIDAAFREQLIRLCHPDKHGNSKAANNATARLLQMRDGTG